MDGKGGVQKVVRKTASSGKVDYAPLVVLHETSRTKLQALAWFIPHSDRTEFSLKLQGFRRGKNGHWIDDEAKTMTLSEVSSIQLLQFLRSHLPLASQDAGGEFILVRVANGEASLEGHDPGELVAALTKVLSQQELVEHLSRTELTHELAGALRGSIRLTEMRAAVAQLRSNLDEGQTAEQVYQEWCERHCWAFGNAYVVRDEIRSISTGDKLDLLLPGVIAGYRDIVELKNHYFSSEVSKAIGQCHRYLDILHQAAKDGLLDHKEVVAYHPRAIIVIGRSDQWTDEQQRALHGLNRRMHGISVMTYDHLLAQGERLIDMMNPVSDDAAPASLVDDDDIPW
jgi:hypothetical protein